MERSTLALSFVVLLACCTSGANAGQPSGNKVPPPAMTPEVRKLLHAMNIASTWGHPDLWGEFTGMQHLFHGEYAKALTHFKFAARFGDKLSQVTIGMMYLHGRGVTRDPAMACAWFALGAERGFARYVVMRNRVCGALSPMQHRRAEQALDRLLPIYGDKVAKQRMKKELQYAKISLTGSHIGFDFGVQQYMPGGGNINPNCTMGPALYIGGVAVPRDGCGSYYDPRLWNAKNYFAARELSPRPSVTVGPVKQVKPEPEKTRHKP